MLLGVYFLFLMSIVYGFLGDVLFVSNDLVKLVSGIMLC